jgi:hypothetical protein
MAHTLITSDATDGDSILCRRGRRAAIGRGSSDGPKNESSSDTLLRGEWTWPNSNLPDKTSRDKLTGGTGLNPVDAWPLPLGQPASFAEGLFSSPVLKSSAEGNHLQRIFTVRPHPICTKTSPLKRLGQLPFPHASEPHGSIPPCRSHWLANDIAQQGSPTLTKSASPHFFLASQRLPSLPLFHLDRH